MNDELKNLINRLNNGESLENVRKDFVEKFSSVSAQEILDAEQKLLDAGTKNVEKLCDVHSALFHTQNANSIKNFDFNSLDEGHPAQILHLENLALEKFLNELENADSENFLQDFRKLFGIYVHYSKKEQLFMPVLYRHGVTGPSKVMWAVDDEIKKSLGVLAKKITPDNFFEHKTDVFDLLRRIREMIFKEENIFIPISMKFFTQEDWLAIYADSAEYGFAFIENPPKWQAGEEFLANQAADFKNIDGKIKFSTGELTLEQLGGIFKLLPVDITFIDENDVIKFFVNNGGIFPRPKSSLGQKVFEFHPPELLPMIQAMLADFKAKKRNRFEVFRKIKGKSCGVVYQAVYDNENNYLGTVEFVQDFSVAFKKF